MKQGNAIMVLNDGETYTGVKGCMILILTDEDLAMIENGEHLSETDPIATIQF